MKRSQVMWFVLVVLALTCGVVVAADPVATDVVQTAPWWQSLLSSEAIWNMVGGLIALLLAYIGKTAWVKNVKAKVDAATWAALEAGVMKTYYDSVKVIKADASKKIDVETAKKLRDTAIENAKEIAKGPAKDALIKMARPMLDVMIEKLVGKMKRENSTPA